MNNVVYTIGYSGFKLEDFVATLKKLGVNALIDVRSSPYSGYFRDYNKDFLAHKLKENNIWYANFKNEFGARQDDRRYYPNGYLDFELFRTSESFKQGVKRITDGMKKGFSFALMCAEKDPIQCHRTIMVAPAFASLGYEVVHICPNQLVSHEAIEKRLLQKYFPDRNQLTLFDESGSDFKLKTDEDYLKEAYRLRNKDIGYKMEDY